MPPDRCARYVGASGSGILAIMAEARLRALDLLPARRCNEQSAPEPNQSLPFLTPSCSAGLVQWPLVRCGTPLRPSAIVTFGSPCANFRTHATLNPTLLIFVPPTFTCAIGGISAGTSPHKIEAPEIPSRPPHPFLRPAHVLHDHRDMPPCRLARLPLDAKARIEQLIARRRERLGARPRHRPVAVGLAGRRRPRSVRHP